MRVFAYCCASFEQATKKAAGVGPVLCPPVTALNFDPRNLEGNDLLFFDLHGMLGDPAWYGDGNVCALTADQIKSVSLDGAVVFAMNCYLADDDSPMMDALLDAGARYVIGGDGQNWAGKRDVYGAGLLGLRFRKLMARGVAPLKALAFAKRWVSGKMAIDRVVKKGGRVKAAQDTLAFKAYHRRK